MKFRNLNSVLLPADEHAAGYVSGLGPDEIVDLASLDYVRSDAQNRKQWPMLKDISDQVEWCGQKHEPETWKWIISAAWRGQRFVNGLDGTMVVLPVRTSKMSKKEFSEMIEQLYAFGSEKGVKWSEKALEVYQTYREAR